MTRLTVITARYPGKALDGTTIRRGAQIVWDPKARKVVSADPARVAQAQAELAAERTEPFIDLDTMWEDDCARRCGL